MPRIRTIKPDFFTSLTIAELPVEARLTFIGLWTQVDDDGRCVDDIRLIRAALWPLDDRTQADVEADLAALAAAALIVRYGIGDRRYLAVTGWREHQKINRPAKSKLPPPPEHPELPVANTAPASLTEGSVSDAGALSEPSVSDAGGLTEGSSRERKGKERKGKEPRAYARASASEPPADDGITSIDVPTRIVIEATGARPSEADAIVKRVRNERNPRSLPALLRTMGRDGELAQMLVDQRAASRKAIIAAALIELRRAPACEHGDPGGDLPHPASGEPLCPRCRRRARMPPLRSVGPA